MSSLLKKIDKRFALRKARNEFQRRCLYIPCTNCPYHLDDGENGKCRVAVELGLEEL